jgi:hypothetical protein
MSLLFIQNNQKIEIDGLLSTSLSYYSTIVSKFTKLSLLLKHSIFNSILIKQKGDYLTKKKKGD